MDRNEETKERLFNLLVFNLPFTNKELFGGGDNPPPVLLIITLIILSIISAVIFIALVKG